MENNKADDKNRLLENLNKQLIERENRRASYNGQKFTFVCSLFVVGLIQLPQQFDLIYVFYIIPFIALCYDFLILGEDYAIKRIGGFILEKYSTEPEADWFKWASKRTDLLGYFSVSLLTILVLLICTIILWIKNKITIIMIVWFLVNFIIIVIIVTYTLLSRRKYWNSKAKSK